MYKLRRLHLDTVGVRENRFAALTLDTVDVDGNPADTLIWMRNGSGKTTIMSLLAAHILPARRDFLAARKKRRRDDVTRTLEDLVLTDDTSHVVAEWEAPDGSLLLTGAVWEWPNRRRPVDHNGAGAQKLRKLFWTMRPDPTVEGTMFEDLPLTHRTRGEVDLAGFHAWIKSRAVAGADAAAVDQIDPWHRLLDDRGFDAGLYRYFVTINATEGGIDALFANIRSENDFARYLLGFVADAGRAASVRDLLRQVATELALRPRYRTEQEFCVDAQPRLATLATAHEDVGGASRERAETARAAAAFRLGLLDAAHTAEAGAEQAAQERRDVDEQRLETQRQADGARRRRDELMRLAAGYWFADATIEEEAAREALAAARTTERAWEAVLALQAVNRARIDVNAHRQAIDAARTQAAPLLVQADRADADLAAALDAELRAVAVEIEHLSRRIDETGTRAEAAEGGRDQAADEMGGLTAEADQLAQRADELERKRTRAVGAGLLVDGVPVEMAVAEAETVLESLRADLDACVVELDGADRAVRGTATAYDEARGRHRDAQHAADTAATTLHGLEERAAQLNRSDAAARLAQTSDLDLLADAGRVLALGEEAIATSQTRLLERGVDASSLRLTVAGLEETSLLPPRPALRQVLGVLDDAGIPAVPGWVYLAEHLPLTAAAALVQERPEICDGAVVYGDLAAAAQLAAELVLDDPVVLAPVTVFGETPVVRDGLVVVGPVAARYDHAAGAVELEARRGRLSEHDQESGRLRTDLDELSRLTADLRTLAADVATRGGAGAVRERASHTAAVLEQAEDAQTAAADAHREAQVVQRELAARREELRGAVTGAQGRLDRLNDLAEDLAALPPVRARLEEIPALRAKAVAARERAHNEARAARREQLDLSDTRARLSTRSGDLTLERGSLTVHGEHRGEVPEGGLDGARRAREQAHRLAREAFDEPELVRRLDDLVDIAAQAGGAWGEYAAEVQERARELAGAPGAADPALRSRYRDEAAQAADQAATRHALAKADLDDAGHAVRERRPVDRPRHAELPHEPVNRADAEAAAAEEDRAAARIQDDLRRVEQRVEALEKHHDALAARAVQLRLRADRFDQWADVAVTATAVSTDPAALDESTTRILDRARRAVARHTEAVDARGRAFEALRRWAADERFALTTGDTEATRRLRKMFLDQPVEGVAGRAGALSAELDQRRARIDQHLEHLDQSQENIVTRLIDLVDAALADLARFTRLSRLPENIGPWGGHEFVQVRPRGERPSQEQARVRVSDLVDQLVAPGASLDMEPVDLVWRATEAAVGGSGFRARILKPDPAQPTQKVDVTEMNKWSGGENLTACLVLFCVMVKLRAENRGGRVEGGVAGGLVPLDNPLGKANYVPFLQLQRTVAAASGVQLLFFTGIGDLPAIRAFDAVLACSKRRSRTGPGTYVTLDEADRPSRSEEIDGIRLVRQRTTSEPSP